MASCFSLLRSPGTPRIVSRPAARFALPWGWSLLAAAALSALNGGCLILDGKSRASSAHPKSEPVLVDSRNFIGDPHLPAAMRRVVILPIWGGSAAPPESAADLDPVFVTALERQMRFEIVPLARDDCRRRFGSESLSSAATLPNGFLQEIAQDFGAQGVLFVDLTAFRAYGNLILGVRAKLAQIDQARLVWSFDEIFSAENPAVLSGIRKFYSSSLSPGGVPADATSAATLSPTRFGAFVADAVFRTLPPR